MQCIVVKSDEFENNSRIHHLFVAPYIFPLTPDYVAAHSLQSLRSNYYFIITHIVTFLKGFFCCKAESVTAMSPSSTT